MGFVSFFLMPSTLYDSKFLTDNQKDTIMRRLKRDRPSINPADKFNFREVLRSVASPHVVIVSIMYFMVGTLLYGLALFLPSIVQQLGFSRNKTQLLILSVGPFVGGFFVTLLSAFFSDRYELRGITTTLVVMLAIAGYALYLGAEDKITSYAALYLMVPGVYAIAPLLSSWMANNSEPHYRRATSVALLSITTNSGGILSTWSFPTKDGPKFRKTTIINLVFAILVAVGSLINVAYLSWRNKVKKSPGKRARLLEKYAELEADKEGNHGGSTARIELGDRHPDFVYFL